MSYRRLVLTRKDRDSFLRLLMTFLYIITLNLNKTFCNTDKSNSTDCLWLLHQSPTGDYDHVGLDARKLQQFTSS